MAHKAIKRTPAASHDESPPALDFAARLEQCRVRLESVELLAASSRRDALVLARALLDDIAVLLPGAHAPASGPGVGSAASEAEPGVRAAVVRALPENATRAGLVAARNALAAESGDGVSDEAIAALRTLVAIISKTAREGSGLRGALGAWGRALRRRSGLQIGVAAGICLLVGSVLLFVNVGAQTRGPEFERLFAQGEAQLTAGKHGVAVDNFRKAIAIAPNDERASAAWNDMSWSLQQLGRDREAIAGYEKALKLRPGFSLAENNLNALKQRLNLK
jgi:tetratricopeptide (TPR) repeat protein